ncbi:hypothetical protein JHW43_005029 [Diplocarpon mali]|nr:hypothetical protein JHW43_005029 [Diplocarpon mali]
MARPAVPRDLEGQGGCALLAELAGIRCRSALRPPRLDVDGGIPARPSASSQSSARRDSTRKCISVYVHVSGNDGLSGLIKTPFCWKDRGLKSRGYLALRRCTRLATLLAWLACLPPPVGSASTVWGQFQVTGPIPPPVPALARDASQLGTCSGSVRVDIGIEYSQLLASKIPACFPAC